MRISDVTTYIDLSKLQKKKLQELCIDLGEDETGDNEELTSRIWPHLSSSQNRNKLHPYEKYLLATRGSVSWYKIEDADIKGLSEKIKRINGNPFESVKFYNNSQLTSAPYIFAATTPEDGKYLLRVVLRDRNLSSLSMNGTEVTPKITSATVYIDENNNIVEVRAPHKFSAKIAGSIASLIDENAKAVNSEILANFDGEMGNLANSLEGKIKESIDIPNQIVDDISDEQVTNIADILKSIDYAIQNDDSTQLMTEIENSKTILLNDFPEISFLCLILAGLGKVRLGASINDLRSSPLYDSISPFLENQGGYIEFPGNDNGVEIECLIQVGIKTKTISFSKFANEDVISFVRSKVLGI